MSDHILFQNISAFVTSLFKQYQNENLLYHNLKHTQIVVKRAYEIASHYGLDEEGIFIVSTAAWFHDTGQLFGETKDHEKRSVSIMRDYLQTKEVENKIINSIEGCIMATKLPHNPATLLEEIICDADTYNLGTKEFLKTDKQIKKEFELRNNIQKEKWEKMTLHFLETHKYFTRYCQALLTKGKQENIEMLRLKINNLSC